MDAAQPPTDHRQLRREFQAVTEGSKRFDSLQDALAAFAAPLVRLFGDDALPTSLKTSAFSHTPASSSLSDNDAVDVLLIEAVQEALLVRIVVDFHSALPQDLVDVWFFGLPHDERKQGLVQQCSLRTISRLLASTHIHHLTKDQLQQLCVRALSRLSLASLIAAVAAEPNKARADVAWTETLRLLTSLPDRLANATEGRSPLTPTSWTERVLVGGFATCLDANTQLRWLKHVLQRLDRLGYLSRSVDTEGRGFWATMLRCSVEREGVARWGRLRDSLFVKLRVKLDRALVETLQYMTRGLPTELVASEERGRAGAEGGAFLGKKTWEGVAAVVVIFGALLPTAQDQSSSSTNSDSGSDDDDSGPATRTIETFKSVALSAIPQSPLLAWSWTVYLSTTLPMHSLHSCLEATLATWADANRIKRSSLASEAFLSTLITCLLASITADPALSAIVHSRTVLDGVSSHLEHSDATVRRLGMLVAELLSRKTAPEGGKVLNFGGGIWNGAGEGREEVRVLRALSDAWRYHGQGVEDVRRRWEGKGLGEAVKAIGVHPGQEVASEVKQVKRKVNKPKMRRLPERVDAPSRSKVTRPLITMLDSEDEADKEVSAPAPTLKMFSGRQRSSPPSPSSSSSLSSSSDDSDSDAPDDDPHSIHRLAASLSGLSPDSTDNLLPTNPRAPSAPITDLAANTESHAPTFTRKTPAPIYISQLSPLLRSSTRSDIRLALHHAAPLIRRKASPLFGAELRENAVDLCLTLVALHDNFGIRRFEEMRRAALVELVRAEGRVTVAVLTEQSFGSQYSDVQRGAMWAAIGEGGWALARGEDGVRGEGVASRADGVVEEVLRAAQRGGEERVPELRRQRQLHVGTARGKLVQLHEPSRQLTSLGGEWDTIAGPVFIFPLINRGLAYQAYRTSGAGSSALFTATTQALFFDTLTVLVSLAPSHTVAHVTPSLLELLAASTDASVSVQTSSLLTLLALTLDRSLHLPPAQLIPSTAAWLQHLLAFTQDVFATLNSDAATHGGLTRKVLARAAAVLLLMDRVDERRSDEVRRLIGFVPA